MRKLIISSTSNLLENNSCWRHLSKEEKLIFSDYGDITSCLFSNIENGLIIVIFLEDLIQNSSENYSSIKASNEAFLKLIEKRAHNSKQPLILCLGSRSQNSLITSSRSNTNFERFKNFLIKKIVKLRDNYETVYFVNLNEIFYHYGSISIFSDRNWYYARCRLSNKGLNILTKNILTLLKKMKTPPKKVLVLDCDNTLWGGVIAEEGLKGIILGQDGIGQAFLDFQKECLKLH